MAVDNTSWNLESFLDSLVVELDKARETLAVKAINRPLTYTVKDLSLDLQIFPTYNGDDVKFLTAQPGQLGSSKLTVQLSSITDQQVRATSKKPTTREEISLDMVDIDNDTKKALRKVGVSSVDDLKQIEKKNIDLDKVSSKKKISYTDLINRIEKARRDKSSRPKVLSVSALEGDRGLLIKGENLAINKSFEPVVVLNKQLAGMKRFSTSEIEVELKEGALKPGDNQVILTLDPYSIVKINIKR